jgi:hypothetical protein
MRMTFHIWACIILMAAILISGGIVAESTQAAKLPNPDPKNIHSSDDGQTFHVTPRNDADDFDNLQWAVDHALPGATVNLGAGTFFLGDGKESPRRTVVIRKGVRVRGEKDGSAWRTVIRGGGEVMTPGVGGPLESGPIRIANEDDPHPVIFEDIWFREWSCEVVFIVASRGFEFRGCRISHPANRDSAGIRFVHAIWTTGVKARGDFTVEDCLVELGGYTEKPSDDEQLLGVFFSNHDTIRIVNNTITGIDEAIEILGNRYGNTGAGDPDAAQSPAEIIVTGNKVDVTGTPGQVWPSSFAILICGNLNVDQVRVEDNHVTKRGKGWGMGLSGANFNIAGNTFRFEEHDGAYPPGAITIGGYGKLAGFEMGNSFDNSVFTDNTFEGKVSKNGIVFSSGRGNVVNDSHGNRFDLGESLAALGAETTLTLSEKIHDNTFEGTLGTVENGSTKDTNKLIEK